MGLKMIQMGFMKILGYSPRVENTVAGKSTVCAICAQKSAAREELCLLHYASLFIDARRHWLQYMERACSRQRRCASQEREAGQA